MYGQAVGKARGSDVMLSNFISVEKQLDIVMTNTIVIISYQLNWDRILGKYFILNLELAK